VGKTPDSAAARHPIRLVALRTGLTPDVIRAWERRYRAIEPTRGTAGHRLYTDHEVERLTLLARAVAAGRPIGQVAGLDDSRLARLVRDDEQALVRHEAAGDRTGARSLLARCRDAVERLAPAELRELLRHALFHLGITRFVDDLLHPLLEWVGERWHAGALGPAHEHAASAVVRRVLDGIAATLEPPAGAPVLVVGTPAGERHELGAMLAAVAGATLGWRAVYLGPDLPAAELAAAANRAGARLLGLSVVAPDDAGRISREVEAVRNALDPSVRLVLGGQAAAAARGRDRNGRVTAVKDLAEFRALLQDLAGVRAAR
jgi:DNA-binding transcriptional MerR regulator/methylmalonyl-CoA mutase cobalamin-binding subunit